MFRAIDVAARRYLIHRGLDCAGTLAGADHLRKLVRRTPWSSGNTPTLRSIFRASGTIEASIGA